MKTDAQIAEIIQRACFEGRCPWPESLWINHLGKEFVVHLRCWDTVSDEPAVVYSPSEGSVTLRTCTVTYWYGLVNHEGRQVRRFTPC